MAMPLGTGSLRELKRAHKNNLYESGSAVFDGEYLFVESH